MVNKPLIRPYFWGGVALGGVARIPMIFGLTSTSKKRTSAEISASPDDSTIDLRLDMAPTRQMWEQNYGALVYYTASNKVMVVGGVP